MLSFVSSKRFEQAGADCVKQFLPCEQHTDFTAITCAYDNIAFGAIKELQKNGFAVPQYISLIGIDNNSLSAYAETSLTSIDTDPC